jgi:NADH:ubiquinone reductase (H+-translocating)
MVASADAEGVTLKDGSRIDSRTIVWGAGVRANDLGKSLGLETSRGDRIVVDADLQVPGHPGVFAAGDIALTITDGDKDKVVPQLAPSAIQGGKHVAAQVKRLIAGKPTSNFHYRDKGIMAVIGRGDAVVELPKPVPFRFGGRLAWLMWLGVHIVYLVGFRNRIKVLVDWGWNYITSRGSSAILVRSESIDAEESDRSNGQKAS